MRSEPQANDESSCYLLEVLVVGPCFRETLDHGVGALGLFRGAPPDTATVKLAPDDVLVFYTDGVVETWDSHDNDYGLPRLEQVVRQSAGLDASAVIDRVVASTQAFTGRTSYDDDFTVMIVRRTDGASRAHPPA
jgi:serine phosphatase RsbU (regulator of sigma subunit)